MAQMFNLSTNIENGFADGYQYIVTPNTRKVVNGIVDNFHAGIHSYTIIGSYGTGKSSFLAAMEEDLNRKNDRYKLFDPKVLSDAKQYDILNIVGDYDSLEMLMAKKLRIADGDIMRGVGQYYEKKHRQGCFLVIVVDEFGKILEHAAKNNPERELYFIQKLAEYVNVPSRKILWITTLHQNFGSYANQLSEDQRNEWRKIKGRFKEIAFVEPVEQLLQLASKQLNQGGRKTHGKLHKLLELAVSTGFVAKDFDKTIATKLFPLDVFSAYAITAAIQRYGQNERSLFSFLAAKGDGSISDFAESGGSYSLDMVYDYVDDNFYSYLRDKNADTMDWSAIKNAINRVEAMDWQSVKQTIAAVKIVKTVGLLNLYGNAGFRMNKAELATYVEAASCIENTESIISCLENARILKYVQYKGREVIYEGTDVNIEEEYRAAGLVVPKPIHYIDDLRLFFNQRIATVKAHFYQRGTPRYFDYKILETPEDITPIGDIDGYVELIFATNNDLLTTVKEVSSQTEHAIIFAYFTDVNLIVNLLHSIKKYKYLLENVVDKSDRVAFNEIRRLIEYEENKLNKEINDGLFAYNGKVIWFYNGKEAIVKSQRQFNHLLSIVCDDVYPMTPTMHNELINRHKLSGTISTARKNYLVALLEHPFEDDLGFEHDKFPPEKTIYYSLLKDTGLHQNAQFADTPTKKDFLPLWDASERFLNDTANKSKRISELIKKLSTQPYKIKQGLIDFWVPTYLFIRRHDFALYDANTGAYIPNINIEFFNLLQKHPNDYMVKKFEVDGDKLEFFNTYRRFINLGEDRNLTQEKFVETIKPFLSFYVRLNDYAKHTRRFDHHTTLLFRDVLAKAKDPEKTFFDDLPDALGFDRSKKIDPQSMRDYGRMIEIAVRELRTCYISLIDRIEERIVEALGLESGEYNDYILEIRERFKNVKQHLLTGKQKEFYQHVITEYDNRVQWYQSICYTILDQRLDTIRDEQEERLIEELLYAFKECVKYVEISKVMTNADETAYSFDMVSTEGLPVRSQTYIVTPQNKDKVESMERRIEEILSGNDDVDVCVLLALLNKKVRR